MCARTSPFGQGEPRGRLFRSARWLALSVLLAAAWTVSPEPSVSDDRFVAFFDELAFRSEAGVS